ncbi:VCBS repeat-containing protein [uncultured Thiocystis sp.]|uniref:FG-GAP repeat domain-containing protein n=1 Tax=uncultured Thiocystis sp. TaxID=1202134 RepID=UPI0025E1D48A|nr:VCBS repeat-containing protein [uncultured Thiocystis sp.]
MAGVFLLGCDGDKPVPEASDPSPSGQAASAPGQTSLGSSVIAYLPLNAPAHSLLIDDIDGDGREDLALTSHHASYTQVFYQQEPRYFTPGPTVDAVGFHPGDLLRLPASNRRLYLMNAEGENRLRVFEPSTDGGLNTVSELFVPAPRTSSVFHWPDWGLGLAIGPFAMSAIFLAKDFDPLTGQHGGGAELKFNPGVAHAHSVAVADIDSDGSDELFFANNISNHIYMIRAPEPGTSPVIETLWTFQPGGRADDVIPADIDQDGDLDLLIPDATDKRKLDRTDVNVLVNDGQGQFQLTQIPFPARTRSEGGIPGINAFDAGKDRDNFTYLIGASNETLVLMRVPAGWAGEPPETRKLQFQGGQVMTKALLRDIDGDGWLDLAMTRAAARNSGVILYGPLWENAGRLEADGVRID